MKTLFAAVAAALALTANAAFANPEEDRRTVAALDTAYQAAVERNDAEAMAAILTEDMVVVLGDGRVLTREDLLRAARDAVIVYEVQDEEPGTQSVRLFGPDTAVVTALLRARGVRSSGARLDLRLWFSDTYVRTPQGWRYAFGQASLPLPNSAAR